MAVAAVAEDADYDAPAAGAPGRYLRHSGKTPAYPRCNSSMSNLVQRKISFISTLLFPLFSLTKLPLFIYIISKCFLLLTKNLVEFSDIKFEKITILFWNHSIDIYEENKKKISAFRVPKTRQTFFFKAYLPDAAFLLSYVTKYTGEIAYNEKGLCLTFF